MRNLLFYSIFMLLWLIAGSVNAQTVIENSYDLTILRSYDLEKIEENMTIQLESYPQEKIHLHTDRDIYAGGEKIMFKAYLIDAHTHLFPTHSRYVYVELINPDDSLVNRAMIRSVDDLFYGQLPLPANIPEGNYTLRAYTRYLENQGDDWFFKKNIRIVNLASTRATGTFDRNHSDDFEVSFFPEGGNLPEGVFCKVAFKALNSDGYPVHCSGEIVDEAGAVITSVQTLYAGMGVFTVIPEAGKRYILKCRAGNGREKQFELPLSHPRASTLNVTSRNNRLLVTLQKAASAPDKGHYLFVHCRGLALYFSEWNVANETIVFDENRLPAGVIQFVLFDEQMNPLSERLVFSKNYDIAKVNFQTDKPFYEQRDKVVVTLSPSLLEREGVRCHLSVAITDDRDIAVDSLTTILSTLLLSSELRGHIATPAYYLQDNIESATALDCLMMTHGWRRYNIPDVLKGNPEYPQIPYQTGQELSGQVNSLMSSKPVANSVISVMTNHGFLGSTTTGDDGLFLLQGFEYPDSTSYFIQALTGRGSVRVELVVDDVLFPKPVHVPHSFVTETPAARDISGGTNPLIVKAEQRSKYDDEMRVIELSEVVVTANRIQRKEELRLIVFPFNADSDVTIGKEDFKKVTHRFASDYLTSIPGLRVVPGSRGNEIYLTARNGSYNATLAVFVDGIRRYQFSIDEIPVTEIESIDVFKGASAGVFGLHGMNGVISVTLKRGPDPADVQDEKSNYKSFTPTGYQNPVEFYAPRYETLEAKQSAVPDYRTTIFWKPDIVITDTGEASFDFYTADFPTTYSVVIEGMTTDGQIIRQIEKIQVE